MNAPDLLPARKLGNASGVQERSVSGRTAFSLRGGFTLAECIVVVGIFCLLVALLFPAFNKARSNALRAQCAANLRQLGAAVHMYAGDNAGNIYVPVPLTTVLFCGKKGAQGHNINDPVRFLNPYLGGPFTNNAEVPVARCPSDKGEPGSSPLTRYNLVGTSYMFNYCDPLHMPTLSVQGKDFYKLINVQKPAKTIMIADHPAFNYQSGGDRKQRWHDNDEVLVNACFVDGHVEFIRIPKPGDSENYPDGDSFTWRP